MFKRGGSSFKAQGTGITSPFDTPRKNYNVGAWGEWEEATRKATKDPRGDWSYAAQGFGHLGSPYKESGEAKMISEMLAEGAGAVRGSREKASDLEQKGELAILESQGGRMLAEEKHQRDLQLAKLKIKATQEELKRIPLARLITDIAKSDPDLKNATPGSFESLYVSGIATGRAHQRREAADGIAVGVLETNRWKNIGTIQEPVWDYKADNLDASIPWYNPVEQRWHVFNGDENGMATGNPVKSFLTVDEALAYIKGGNQEIIEESQTLEENNAQTSESDIEKKQEELEKRLEKRITTNLKDVDINDKEVIYDEAAKVGITIKANPGGSKVWLQNLAEDEMSLPAFKKLLTQKKMRDTYENINPGRLRKGNIEEEIKVTEKMAGGGRAGYAEGDVAITELDMLNNWWKNMQANDWKE